MDTSIDATEFKWALGSFMTGVTLVTTGGSDGEPRGFTANSFTSVSLNPRLVIADPAVRTMLARCVRERTEEAFGVAGGSDLEGQVQPPAKPASAAVPSAGQVNE